MLINIKIKNLIFLFFLMISLNGISQKEISFETKKHYLSFLKEEFNINPNYVYEFYALNDTTYIGNLSSLLFIKGTQMTTIDSIIKQNQNLCPPKKLLDNLSVEKIENSFFENTKLSFMSYKNLEDNTIIESPKELTALFLFTYKLGKTGLQYIRYKDALEKLNIRCLIITLDEAYIQEISNKNSTRIVVKENR
jgi:hypothetical protein